MSAGRGGGGGEREGTPSPPGGITGGDPLASGWDHWLSRHPACWWGAAPGRRDAPASPAPCLPEGTPPIPRRRGPPSPPGSLREEPPSSPLSSLQEGCLGPPSSLQEGLQGLSPPAPCRRDTCPPAPCRKKSCTHTHTHTPKKILQKGPPASPPWEGPCAKAGGWRISQGPPPPAFPLQHRRGTPTSPPAVRPPGLRWQGRRGQAARPRHPCPRCVPPRAAERDSLSSAPGPRGGGKAGSEYRGLEISKGRQKLG